MSSARLSVQEVLQGVFDENPRQGLWRVVRRGVLPITTGQPIDEASASVDLGQVALVDNLAILPISSLLEIPGTGIRCEEGCLQRTWGRLSGGLELNEVFGREEAGE